jgi:DNA invertase Pin-like site-specific DNA recombinase
MKDMRLRSRSKNDAAESALPRVVGYARVSTGKQADRELSLPVQQRKIEAYCADNNSVLDRMFTDPGHTGRNPNRRGLRQLMDYALDPVNDVSVVALYNFSRLMRRLLSFEQYAEKLENAGIEIVSVQQPLPKGATGKHMRRMLASMDEYESDLKADVTRDAMVANAEQGYWNGSSAPFGYEARVVATYGTRSKRKLFIDEASAAIVRRIFSVYLEGDGKTGPLGCDALAIWLDNNGYRYKGGRRFSAKTVNAILNDEAYVGRVYFNARCSRTGRIKPRDEWVLIPVEPIIEEDVFNTVQARLSARNPRKLGKSPRADSSPLLLAGLVRCGECGSTMIQASGKGYHYYSCRSSKARTGCSGHSVPKQELERMVLDAVHARAFSPPRLGALDQAIATSMLDRSGDLRRELDAARTQLADIVRQIDAMIDKMSSAKLAAVVDRVTERVTELAGQRAVVAARIKGLEAAMQHARRRSSKAAVGAFARDFRAELATAAPAAVRSWIQTQVAGIEIDGESVQLNFK